MFNVTRTGLPPQRGDATLQALHDIFFSKCYLCESIKLSDKEIDHFQPKSSFPSKTHDWENLYLICRHCNGIKSANENRLLDCCDPNTNVFEAIKILPSIPYEKLNVTVMIETVEARETAQLLDRVLNTPNDTLTRRLQSKTLRHDIFEHYNLLQKHIIECTNNKEERSINEIKQLISKEAAYSACMRWFILEHFELRTVFEIYMD